MAAEPERDQVVQFVVLRGPGSPFTSRCLMASVTFPAR